MTDAQRILQLFRTSQGRRISCAELVEGNYFGSKKIIEYSGRITDARKIIGCSCGKDPNACTASEHILNIKRNWYQYRGSLDVVEVIRTREEQVVMKRLSYPELLVKRAEIIEKWGDPKELDSISLARFKAELLGNGCDRQSLLEAKGQGSRSTDFSNTVKESLF
jgi:hypothetical protein